MWRCPHCGTPQAETARCWVCKQSSTACGTCRNFRRSVAGSLGYCGLDRRRQPLVGDEIRACWEAAPGGVDLALISPITVTARPERLEFVEVGDASAIGAVMTPGDPVIAPDEPATRGPAIPPLATPSAPRWDLWGDLDR